MTYLCIITALVFWASAFVGIRVALIDYTPLELAVFRLIVASITLFVFMFSGKITFPKKEDLGRIFCLGLTYFINMIALNLGERTITASETTFLLNTSQFFTIFLACIVLHETISTKFMIGLIFGFLGVAIITIDNSTGFAVNIGIFYILIAAMTWSIFLIVQKPLLTRYQPLEVISYAIWTATMFMLPLGRSVLRTIPLAGIESTAAIIYIGIFATVLANVCWSKVLSTIAVSHAVIFLYTIPVITIIIGFLWLRELPSLVSCIGGTIVVGGVIFANMKRIMS